MNNDLNLNVTDEELNNTKEIIDINIDTPIYKIGNKINVYLKNKKTLGEASIAMITNYNGNISPIIIVDEYFMMLQEDSKKFVLYHEIGHYINGDLDKEYYTLKESFSLTLSLFLNTLNYEEQNADLYALRKINNNLNLAKKCFDDIKNICEKQIEDDYKDRTEKYINNLKRKNTKDFNKRFRKLIDNYLKNY